MRVPASVVAIPLLAGCVAGLLLAEGPNPQLGMCAAAGASLAFLAALTGFVEGSGADLTVAIAIGAGLAGVSLGFSDAHRAAAPPVLRWFDGCDGADREGPTVLEGVLTEDAVPTASGA